jgi:hypothetical protein
LIIGKDPYGGFINLLVGPDGGIYYYDHAHQLATSTPLNNAYKLAESFSVLAEQIGVPIVPAST